MPQANKMRSWLERLRTWFTQIRRNRSRSPAVAETVCSVVYLPQAAACMDGQIRFSIPADFKVIRNKNGQIVFFGRRCGLTLTVSKMPFTGSLRWLQQEELQRAFSAQHIAITVEQFERGYVRHAPRVTVRYTQQCAANAGESVVILIQKRKSVYSLLFTGAVTHNLPVIEAMVTTLELP